MTILLVALSVAVRRIRVQAHLYNYTSHFDVKANAKVSTTKGRQSFMRQTDFILLVH